MWSNILEILATLVRWLKGTPSDAADTRVRQLEDAAAKERERQREDFDAQAADVRTADDAVELLNSATRKPPPN